MTARPTDKDRAVPLPTHFSFETPDGPLAVGIDTLVVAGWTGRDKAAMEAHIAELEAIGVPRPATTPCFYRGATSLLTQAPRIQVVGGETSGEVEFFVLQHNGAIWVGVGSDHTDRALETHSVSLSKQVCAKPIGRTLWPLAALEDHWDALALRSFATIDGVRMPYQGGPVTTMLPPADLIAGYRAAGGTFEDGTLMFCGTLAVQGGVRPATRFEIEMHDPKAARTLSHAYDIEVLPDAG
ncbi:MAG: DUF2848 domain-containing protein [Alphaproteobacteria bacterium]